MATNTYIIAGSFTSAGTAYDLQLPIQAVQTSAGGQIATTTTQPSLAKFVVSNFTEWGVASKIQRSTWFKGFAAGVALQEGMNSVPEMVNTVESTNGFTLINDTPRFGVEVVGVTKANPGVVTFRGPGFNPGQGISAFATGDTFKFNFMGGSSGTDWSGLNGTAYVLTKISSLTFSFAVDTSGYTGTYTASSGLAYRTVDVNGNKIPPLNVANVGIKLGTAVVGAASDVMYWEATITDDFRALGQL